MKKFLWSFCFITMAMAACGQEFVPYGVERQMPIYLDSMTTKLTYPMAWGNAPISDFSTWRDSARKILKYCMMLEPPRARDYAAEIIATEQRDGYRASIVQLNISGWLRANVYMLTPDTPGPHPAVLLFHDHGGHFLIGKEKMVKPILRVPLTDKGKGNIIYNQRDTLIINDSQRWLHKCYGNQYWGDELARNGFVVVCGDAIFWGERGRKEGVDPRKLNEFAGNLMGMGYCMSGLTTYEDALLAEWMATQPEIDPERLVCAGFSMGAYRAWMLSAFTDVVKGAACVCWMTTTANQFSWLYGRENGGYANTLPMIRHYMDHPHVASIGAPKPTLFINGTQDKLFKVPGVTDAYATMHQAWNDAGAPDHLLTELRDMPHWCGPEVTARVLEFLQKFFGN